MTHVPLPAALASRIVGHGDEAPDQLLANPRNFRRHPNAQRDALRGSLRELGWVKSVIVNRTTGHVLDGHARVEEALAAGVPTIPVEYVELSEAEERLALAVLDPITEMATRDADTLNALLGEVDTNDDGLRALLDTLAASDTLAHDTSEQMSGLEYRVLIDCKDEAEQTRWLERLDKEGVSCRALIV